MLRREVIVIPAALRRLTSMLGLSMVLVLMASAADAVVWTYQVQRRIYLQEQVEHMRSARMRRDLGMHRARAERPRSQPAAIGSDEGAPRPHGRVCMMPRHRD